MHDGLCFYDSLKPANAFQPRPLQSVASAFPGGGV